MSKDKEKTGQPEEKAAEELIAENAGLAERNAALEKENAELKKPAPQINVRGFVLEHDDPFAAGVMRTYVKVTKARQVQRAVLPFVLPESDPASQVALKDYIVRAAGGGDKARAESAKKHLR